MLIVGAGPTGLMLANRLARHGIEFVIIDRHAGPVRETRAVGVQARSVELFATLGIADAALAAGKANAGGNLWANGRPMARIPIGDAGAGLTPYPFVLILGQDDTERILLQRLRESGAEVRWQTELLALEQDASAVRATLRLPDGSTQTLDAEYVAGCDGSHSAVRERSGIAFVGGAYEQVFFVADTRATGPMVPEELNVFLWRRGFHLFFPMRGERRWRVIGILPAGLADRAQLDFTDVAPYVHRESNVGIAFEACDWFSTYRIHHRRAASFRRGRCFLLGDAAHVHSPLGAQGMNTGLQDACNLAWKLAFVVSGRAAPALLDTYEAERLPVAERLLHTTDRAFRMVVADHWLAALFRTRVLARLAALAMRVPPLQRAFFRTLSQIGIRYRLADATTPHLPAPAPQPGERFPPLALDFDGTGRAESCLTRLDDTRFNLLVFDDAPADAAASSSWVTQRLPDTPVNGAACARLGIERPAHFLLRPDGHVAAAGRCVELESLQRVSITAYAMRERSIADAHAA